VNTEKDKDNKKDNDQEDTNKIERESRYNERIYFIYLPLSIFLFLFLEIPKNPSINDELHYTDDRTGLRQ